MVWIYGIWLELLEDLVINQNLLICAFSKFLYVDKAKNMTKLSNQAAAPASADSKDVAPFGLLSIRCYIEPRIILGVII